MSSSASGSSSVAAFPVVSPPSMGQLEDALGSVVSVLEEQGIPYMVIGGLANLVWGVARATQDIDVTIRVEPADLADTVSTLTRAFSALPEDPLAFVQQTRVLPVATANGIRADLIFAELPYQEQAIHRARSVRLGDVTARVCSPEDLILSERPKDLDDVRGIVRTQGANLDRAYLDPLVLGLAVDLERPEIQEFYASLWRPPARRN